MVLLGFIRRWLRNRAAPRFYVRLKSGGPPMQVVKIEDNRVTCTWRSDYIVFWMPGRRYTERFHIATLIMLPHGHE